MLRLRSRLTTATPGMLSPVLSPLTMVPPLAVVSPLTPLTMVPPLTPPLAVVPPLARPGPGDWDLLEPALVTDLRDLALVTLLQVEILHQGIIVIMKEGPCYLSTCPARCLRCPRCWPAAPRPPPAGGPAWPPRPAPAAGTPAPRCTNTAPVITMLLLSREFHFKIDTFITWDDS